MESKMDQKTIIEFLKEIEKFKTCERTCQTTRAGRAESDAEHSWHLALFLMLFENEFKGIDFLKTLKIALIHDLPEIYAGDINPFRGDTTNKAEDEKRAAAKLFKKLPEALSNSFTGLFEEYINQASDEAKIVKAADKLMPLIQNICTNDHHSSYRKLEVEYKEVVNYMDGFFSDGILEVLYRKLLYEAEKQGVFYTNDSPAC